MLTFLRKVGIGGCGVLAMLTLVQPCLAAALLMGMALLLVVKDVGTMLACSRTWLEAVATLKEVLT